jgi:hypothetical protein
MCGIFACHKYAPAHEAPSPFPPPPKRRQADDRAPHRNSHPDVAKFKPTALRLAKA